MWKSILAIIVLSMVLANTGYAEIMHIGSTISVNGAGMVVD